MRKDETCKARQCLFLKIKGFIRLFVNIKKKLKDKLLFTIFIPFFLSHLYGANSVHLGLLRCSLWNKLNY